MKCSECTRRNSDDNRFCIYCGTALEASSRQGVAQSEKHKKVMLPPQDLDTLIASRNLAASRPRAGVHPVAVIGLALVISFAGIYYWYFYRDVFIIRAIDYQQTDLINGR